MDGTNTCCPRKWQGPLASPISERPPTCVSSMVASGQVGFVCSGSEPTGACCEGDRARWGLTDLAFYSLASPDHALIIRGEFLRPDLV